MTKANSAEKRLVYEMGFWSATVATVLVVVAGITATASIQPFATIIGFLLTSSFLVVMACIHSSASQSLNVELQGSVHVSYRDQSREICLG
jgi:hypothetical protein